MEECFGAYNKLSKKCSECNHKLKCGEKYLENYGNLIYPSMANNISMDNNNFIMGVDLAIDSSKWIEFPTIGGNKC